MIRNHEFNTEWWGGPVGFVFDAGFFDLPDEERAEHLAPYAWAEFHAPIDQAPPARRLQQCGFFQADTMVQFVLNLGRVESSPSTALLDCRFATGQAFQIAEGALAPFSHERFRFLPGASQAETDRRYAVWANRIIEEHPGTCMQLVLEDRLQGWFLSKPGEHGRLNLTLAMLSGQAEVSGMLLYQRACIAYAERGNRLGSAGFSVSNTPVHNIYAALGARFLPPLGNWMWISRHGRMQSHD